MPKMSPPRFEENCEALASWLPRSDCILISLFFGTRRQKNGGRIVQRGNHGGVETFEQREAN